MPRIAPDESSAEAFADAVLGISSSSVAAVTTTSSEFLPSSSSQLKRIKKRRRDSPPRAGNGEVHITSASTATAPSDTPARIQATQTSSSSPSKKQKKEEEAPSASSSPAVPSDNVFPSFYDCLGRARAAKTLDIPAEIAGGLSYQGAKPHYLELLEKFELGIYRDPVSNKYYCLRNEEYRNWQTLATHGCSIPGIINQKNLKMNIGNAHDILNPNFSRLRPIQLREISQPVVPQTPAPIKLPFSTQQSNLTNKLYATIETIFKARSLGQFYLNLRRNEIPDLFITILRCNGIVIEATPDRRNSYCLTLDEQKHSQETGVSSEQLKHNLGRACEIIAHHYPRACKTWQNHTASNTTTSSSTASVTNDSQGNISSTQAALFSNRTQPPQAAPLKTATAEEIAAAMTAAMRGLG